MIIRLEDVCTKKLEEFGNKSKNLSVLMSKGFKVPLGITLDFSEYLEFMNAQDQNHWEKTIQQRIEVLLQGSLETGGITYAVRSSTSTEDSQKSSYAGHFCSLLGVEMPQLANSMAQVYSQALDITNRGIVPSNTLMGILIQEMMEAQISGVMFTYNFINGSEESIVLELTRGRCSQIVGGEVSPSLYVLNKVSGRLLLCEDKLNLQINPQKLKQVLDCGKRIEAVFGECQDIEFLVNFNNDLYVLQSRPICVR